MARGARGRDREWLLVERGVQDLLDPSVARVAEVPRPWRRPPRGGSCRPARPGAGAPGPSAADPAGDPPAARSTTAQGVRGRCARPASRHRSGCAPGRPPSGAGSARSGSASCPRAVARGWVATSSVPAEELDHPREDPGVEPLADLAVRHRVVAAVDHDVAVRVDLGPPRLDQLERLGRQRQQGRPLVGLEHGQRRPVGRAVLARPGPLDGSSAAAPGWRSADRRTAARPGSCA